MVKKIFLIIAICVIPLHLNADTIVLKDGRAIEVEKAWEEDGKVKCYRGSGILGFPKGMVERIEKTKIKEEKEYTEPENHCCPVNFPEQLISV